MSAFPKPLTEEVDLTLVAPPKLTKLDFGCGPNPREGFEGVDILPFDGKVKHVLNVSERMDWNEISRVKNTDGSYVTLSMPDLQELAKTAHFKPWPWADSSVEEAYASHFLEHLTNLNDKWERVHFFNELYRILIPQGKCTIVIPHWCSNRYYGDPTHKEPFGEMGYFYLSREWRKVQAPHTDIEHNPNGYSCDFEASWGYAMHESLVVRNQEYQQHALQFWKEACQDLIATVTCRK